MHRWFGARSAPTAGKKAGGAAVSLDEAIECDNGGASPGRSLQPPRSPSSSSSGGDTGDVWDSLRELSREELVELCMKAAVAHDDVRALVASAVAQRASDGRGSDTEPEGPPEGPPDSSGLAGLTASSCAQPRAAPSTAVSLRQLSGDILDVVFSKLPHDSLSRAACVCRAWRGAANHRWRALHAMLLARQAQEQQQLGGGAAAVAAAAAAAAGRAPALPAAAGAAAAPAAIAAMGRAPGSGPPAAPPPVASWQQFTALSYQLRLCHAAEARDEEQAKHLLERGALPDCPLEVGTSPVLWTAIRTGQQSLAALLLRAGASPLTPLGDGAYLFHCVITGDVETATMLLDAGMPVDTMTRLCPHYFDNRWHSAFVAAMEGDADLAEFLSRQGYDEALLRSSLAHRLEATRQSATRCMTALQRACIAGAADLARLLIKHGAKPCITAGGKDRTALHLAIRHLRPSNPALPDIVALLLSAGADVHTPDAAGNTPLGLLVKRGTVTTDAAEIRRVQRTIESVLQAGSCPDTPVFKGNGQAGVPALLAAVNHQHYGIARLLLQHGADVNVIDPRNGYTVLRKVVNRICEYPTMKPRARAFFDVLCAHPSINCSLVATDGLTALQMAQQRGLYQVVVQIAACMPLPDDRDTTPGSDPSALTREGGGVAPPPTSPARLVMMPPSPDSSPEHPASSGGS